MAAILIICCIFQKVILVIFCFVICFLLTIYVSKYLQFPLNTSTDCQNHVTVHAFVEDNGRSNFSFCNFLFSQLWRVLAKKLMNRPVVFIIYFQIPVQIVWSFTIWIFFSKFSWLFQFNVQFFHFAPLLQENLWKDLPILWLVFKPSIIMCTLTKFCHLKIFGK